MNGNKMELELGSSLYLFFFKAEKDTYFMNDDETWQDHY